MWLPFSDALFFSLSFFSLLKVLAKISKCQSGIYASGGGVGWGGISDTVYDFYYMFHTVQEMEF